MSDTEKQPGKPMETEGDKYKDSVFHYSRERRLDRASPAVQALNEGNFVRMSFFKTLFSTRSNRFIFIIIFLITAMGFSTRITGGRDAPQEQGLRLGGNTVAMTIIPVEGTLFLGIVKSAPRSGELYTGAVDIAVSPVVAEGEDPVIFSHRIFFNPALSESFQISLPFFEETDFFVVLSTEDEHRSVRLGVREN